MALRVDSTPPQSFFAAFDLSGTADQGELVFYTPVGTTLAVLNWTPTSAQLRTNGEVTAFESLEALALQTTGAAIPIRTLFDWLAGRATQAAGWQVDMAQYAGHRITAQRSTPLPNAELKLFIDP